MEKQKPTAEKSAQVNTGVSRKKPWMTEVQAEEIIMAVKVGMFNIDYPGNGSRLAHARLLLSSIHPEEEKDEKD